MLYHRSANGPTDTIVGGIRGYGITMWDNVRHRQTVVANQAALSPSRRLRLNNLVNLLGPAGMTPRTRIAMRFMSALCAMAIIGTGLGAQVPTARDSAARAKAKADSIPAADSIAIVRELERMQGAKPDTTRGPVTGPQGSTNPRLLPDFSAVGDFVADLSPQGSTQAE